AAGFAGGFAGALLAGGDLGTAFSAGLKAGLLGAAAGAIGGLDISRYSKVLAHGITGGAYAEVNGSSFGSGFLASGFAAGFSHFGPDFAPSTWVDDVVAAAVIGGTAAEI